MSTVRLEHQILHRGRLLLIRLDLVRVDLKEAASPIVVLLMGLTHLLKRLILATDSHAHAIRNILRLSEQLLVVLLLLHLMGRSLADDGVVGRRAATVAHVWQSRSAVLTVTPRGDSRVSLARSNGALDASAARSRSLI